MKNHSLWIVLLLLALPAAGQERPADDVREVVSPDSPHPRFVLVFQPGEEALPDLARYGATRERDWQDRVFIRISEEQARELSKHPRVKYLQRILFPGETSGYVPAEHPAPADRVASDAVTNPSWSSGEYKYDGSGNIIRIGTDYYAYDQLNRVARTSLTGTSAYETYAYDSFGNLTYRGRTEGSSYSQQDIPVNGWDNKINGATYDTAGNFKSGGGSPYSYDWDPFKMIMQQYGNGRQDYYVYDAEDERIGVLNSPMASWKWTIRDLDGDVVREFASPSWGGSWMWIEDFAHFGASSIGSERDAADGGRRHFHHDHLGTVRMVTNHNGQALSRHDYNAFGLETTSIRQEGMRGYDHESSMRFTSHERDFNGGTLSENGDYLDYMHARYYKPSWGRFLSTDPKLQVERALHLPQQWNRYAYALNNPIKYSDPTGEDISIAITFSGGKGYTEEEKRQIMELIAAWYRGMDVGKVYVFDAAKASHGGNMLMRAFSDAQQDIEVTSDPPPPGVGKHNPDLVYGGEYAGLPHDKMLQAIANTVLHETVSHKYGIGDWRDLLWYDRDLPTVYHYQALTERMGTVVDSHLNNDDNLRGNLTDRPVPIHPVDRKNLEGKMKDEYARPPKKKD